MRAFLLRHKLPLLCCAAILLLAAGFLWFTRPQGVDGDLGNRPAVSAFLVQEYEEPDANGVRTWHSIETESPGQIRELLSLLRKYPYSRKPDFSKVFGVSNWAFYYPLTTMTVSVSSGDKTGFAEYRADSEGHMQASNLKSSLFPCGIGRFGTRRTAEYCRQLQVFFTEKCKDPDWKTVQDVRYPPGPETAESIT